MSPLYFGLDVICLFEARVPEFEPTPPPDSCESVQCTVYKHWTLRQIWDTSFELAEYICPKYNDDISLLI
jgi:hypothetical protein